jgi:hypothetical protein
VFEKGACRKASLRGADDRCDHHLKRRYVATVSPILKGHGGDLNVPAPPELSTDLHAAFFMEILAINLTYTA